MTNEQPARTSIKELRARVLMERERLDRAVTTGQLDGDRLTALIRRARGIVQRWQPTEDQTAALLQLQLSHIEEAHDGLTHVDFIHRCLYLVRIDRLLHSLMPTERAASSWLHAPNASEEFGGLIPLDLLCEEDLLGCARVLAHLEVTATERGTRCRDITRTWTPDRC